MSNQASAASTQEQLEPHMKKLPIRTLAPLALGLCLGAASLPAAALDAIAVEGGKNDQEGSVDRFGIALKWDWGMKWWQIGDWAFGGYWEVGANYWNGDKGRYGNDSLGDFYVMPVFRYSYTGKSFVAPFVEAGVGANFYTDHTIGNRQLDLEFAFGSHVGTGIRFGEKQEYELLYRYQHQSNAGIGKDNPGINFHLVQLGYHF